MSAEPRVRSVRRETKRAIWERGPAPEGFEQFALNVALRYAGMRWLALLYGVGFVVDVAHLAVSPRARILDAVLAVVFLAMGAYTFRFSSRAQEAVERWAAALGRAS